MTASRQKADKTTTIDLACDRCGYKLRSSQSQSTCPECGLPIAETLAAEASRLPITGLTVLHDVMVLGCSVWVAPFLLTPNLGYRGGIPPASAFVIKLILPIAIGTGLSIGCLRDPRAWRTFIGTLGLGVCGSTAIICVVRWL